MIPIATSSLDKERPLVAHIQTNNQECILSSSRYEPSTFCPLFCFFFNISHCNN